MANVSKPCGLKPLKSITGAPYNGQCRVYYRGTGDANAIYVGDPVALGGSADTNGVPDVVKWSSGAMVGAVVGVLPVYPGVSLVASSLDLTDRHLSASTAGYLLVCDDPEMLFEIQDGFTVAASAAEIGLNCDFALAAGGANYSDSGTTTGTTAATTTASLPLKLMGLVQKENNAFGTYAKLLVKINNHQLGGGTGSTGV